MTLPNMQSHETEVTKGLADHLNGVAPTHYVKDRADGSFLVFELASPHERFFKLLEQALQKVSEENPFKERTTILRRDRQPVERLSLPETQYLRAAISESLTIDRHSFEEDFFSRYTSSVTNLEYQITTNANFIVYGRRGSGKSSLLAYGMHTLRKRRLPFVWVAMQVYANRPDSRIAVDLLKELLIQLATFPHDQVDLSTAQAKLGALDTLPDEAIANAIKKVVPDLRRLISTVTRENGTLTIFLDDIHVVPQDIQPDLLGALYSIARGNRTYIKTSGIEPFSRPWDSSRRVGLEPIHDAQILRLDYNLTMPDKSKRHITGILDAHARYCGLPSISYLAGDQAVSRLVWVAAAVPRDALSLFSAAIAKGIAKDEKRVSVTSINSAASESAEAKLKDIEKDAASQKGRITDTLDRVRDFCIQEKRKNAFLLEIQNTHEVFQDVQNLIALRLVHILHEGITPHRAGKRFMALMLDYGFYVGMRAARSIDLFQKEPTTITAKELRKLPVLPLDV